MQSRLTRLARVERAATRLARDERGFTLMELLVTILIVGILAAIAIAVFLGQGDKGRDASAKSEARTLVSYMDACYVPNENFTKCATRADAEAEDLDWGTNPGQVSVVNATSESYEIEAVSEAKTGSANNVFTVERAIGTGAKRTCTGDDGCRNGAW